MTHKQWLDNEYSEWVKALQESTVHNFKEHPVVKRMLGEIDIDLFHPARPGFPPLQLFWKTILTIEDIGKVTDWGMTGTAYRYLYYAQEILKRNPTRICEIGGGVGQFYAILRAIGYTGEYYIEDLPEVNKFQRKYLKEVKSQTGVECPLKYHIKPNFVVSFYAFGEFDDELKKEYFNKVIKWVKHGYIAFNPHSGASDDLSLFKHDIKVTPGLEPGIKIVEW